MEKKNLAEILCNCPRGMKLDSPAFSELEFDHVDDKGRIKCLAGKIKDEVSLSKYGCVNNSPYANCVIFPEGKDTWEGFCPPLHSAHRGHSCQAGVASEREERQH